MPGLKIVALGFAALVAWRRAASAQDYPNRPMTVIGTTPARRQRRSRDAIFRRARQGKDRPAVGGREQAGRARLDRRQGGGKREARRLHAVPVHQWRAVGEPVSAEELTLRSGKDFTLVARLFRLDFTLMVNPEKTPVKTVAELTAFLKAKKGSVSFGYFSSSMQALAEQYRHLIGIEAASPAAYRNPAQMMTELEAGDFDFSFHQLREYSLKPNPKLRALAIASEKRSALLPDVPTQVEAGLPRRLPLYSWFGFCVPSGTPETSRQRRSTPIMLEIAKRDETRQFLKTFCRRTVSRRRCGIPRRLATSPARTGNIFVKLAKIDAQ